MSLQWVVSGIPTPPTTEHVVLFASEERCKQAAEAIKTEISAPISGDVKTYGRVVCFARKDK